MLVVFWMKLFLGNLYLKSIEQNKWETKIYLPEKYISNPNITQNPMQCMIP